MLHLIYNKGVYMELEKALQIVIAQFWVDEGIMSIAEAEAELRGEY